MYLYYMYKCNLKNIKILFKIHEFPPRLVDNTGFRNIKVQCKTIFNQFTCIILQNMIIIK